MSSRQQGESWEALAERIRTGVSHVLVLTPQEADELAGDAEQLKALMALLQPQKEHLWIAVREPQVAAAAQAHDLRVITTLKHLKELLDGDEQLEEALRLFWPSAWQQQLRSRLQTMGLLSLPKARIWFLVGLSLVLFWFVVFRLLPSAEVRIRPRRETVSQTMNIYLVQSGATMQVPLAAKKVFLYPVTITVHTSMTYQEITPEFTGTRAHVPMTVVNESDETVTVREGSRLSATGGIVFRLTEPVIVRPKSRTTVQAVAEDLDLYGKIIGSRGNVPEGLRWEFTALGEADRRTLYGRNLREGRNGTTASITRLKESDLDNARKKMEATLRQLAQEKLADRIAAMNAETPRSDWRTFSEEKLVQIAYHDEKMPRDQLGKEVTQVPVGLSMTLVVQAYDASNVLELVRRDIASHIEEDKVLLQESVDVNRLSVLPIHIDPSRTWVKVTADLSATEEYLLDQLTPVGAKFARRVREAIVGKSYDEAVRVIRNMPEVERVTVSLWPPWSRRVTSISGNIRIVQE